MRIVRTALAAAWVVVLSAPPSRGEDAAGSLRTSVLAARAAFEAGHWPEASANARAILSRIDKNDSASQAVRGDLLRLLAECHQADAADAVKAYDSALAAGNRSAEILEGKGRALLLLDRDADAVPCFDQSLALRPDHAATLEARGLARMDLHDNAAALADISRAAKLAPAEARYLITLAAMHLRLGDVPAANAALEQAIRLAKEAGDDCRRGEALIDLRRYREAVEAQTAALGRDPKNLRALYLRSAAHSAKHDAKAALDDAREIARLDPRDAGHWLRIGVIERDGLHDEVAALKSFDRGLEIAPRDVALLVARGRLKFQKNDYDGARADLDAAAAANPHALEVDSARAAMHSRRREFKEAIAIYDRLHGIVSRNPDTLRQRANVKRTMGNEKDSLADCDAALALLPPGDFRGRGLIQRAANRWPEAIEACTRAIAADPKNHRLFYDRAWIYNETKEYAKAAADCRAALAIDPDDEQLQEEMAYSLKGAGNHDEAIAFFTKLIDRNPRGNASLYGYRGDARMARKEYAAARADYERACDLEPKNPHYFPKAEDARDLDLMDRFRVLAKAGNSAEVVALADKVVPAAEKLLAKSPKALAKIFEKIAAAYESQGQYAQADTCFAEAIRLEPGRAQLYVNRATLLVKQKRWANAIAALDRAIEIEPTHADFFFWRGRCREESTDLDGAEADFKEAIRLAPEDKAKQAALDGIRAKPGWDVLKRFVALSKGNNNAEIVAIADKLVPAAEKLLATSPEASAAFFAKIAAAHESESQYSRAEAFYTRALAIREKALGPDHVDTAASLNNLAQLYIAQGQYAQAEPLLKRSLAIHEKALGPDHPNTATSLNNLGTLYESQGQYTQSEPLLKRALAIREKTLGPDDPATATSLNNLAQLYIAQGQYAQAEPLYKRSLAICEKSLGPDHPDTATSLNNLAGLYYAQGQYAQAEPLYKRALAIREKTLGPDDPATAASLNNLATLYTEQGKYPQALPLLERSMAIQGKSLGPNHPATASSLNNLAGLYTSQGMYAEAEKLYERALAICEKSLAPDHPSTATSLNNLAAVYKDQGQYARAEPLYERALAICEKSLGIDHPDTVASLASLAAHQAALGRLPDAVRLTDRARRGTRRHVARVLPSLPAAEQAVFLRTQDEASFHACLSLAVHKRANPNIAALSAGWLANGKAVAQEAASQQVILARQSENPATKAAVGALERVRAELAKLAQMKPSPEQTAAYRAKIASVQKEEQELVRGIGGQLAALDRDEPWVEIDAIRKNIPAGGVLVDIARFGIFDYVAKGRDDPWQPARYAAWVIPPAGQGDITILDLGPAEEIDAAVAAYRKAIKAVQDGGFPRGQGTAEDELKITAAPLTQKVLQPIVEAIGSATEIVLSPDGALWLVPWQALPLADGSYAIEKFSIRTVTSARDLVPPPDYAKNGTGSSRGPVVVADPAFDAAPPASDSSAESQTRSLAPTGRVIKPAKRLPATLAEAKASAAALAKIFSREPRQFTGASATEENVKREAVRPPALVLATHGFFLPDQVAKRDDSPGLGGSGSGSRGTRAVTASGEPIEDPLLRCGLLLAGANLTNAGKSLPGDDGILTGAEIVGLDLLGTDLVVLSACQTGEGKVNVGEGVAGLRQAFQIAGAKSVVATLWQVPDRESGQIMQTFYANVARGQAPSKALREAQLAFIKARREDRNYEAAHPYLWAAYGVTGR